MWLHRQFKRSARFRRLLRNPIESVNSGMPRPREKPGSFRWPPGPVEVKPLDRRPRVAPAPVEVPAITPNRLSRWWRAIEQTWLGVTIAPVRDRMTAAGWQPDQPGAACVRCGRDVAQFEADDSGCPTCRTQRLPWDRLVRLGRYEPPLDGWVREVKFNTRRATGVALGELLGRAIAAVPEANGARLVLVPVPTSRWRIMRRGIDHPRLIATSAARAIGASVWPCLRRKHRPPQVNMPASARGGNVSGTMRLSMGLLRNLRRGFMARVSGQNPPFAQSIPALKGLNAAEAGKVIFVVVDDVTTTRATLREACRSLRKGLKSMDLAHVRVWAAVVAATPERAKTGSRASELTPNTIRK